MAFRSRVRQFERKLSNSFLNKKKAREVASPLSNVMVVVTRQGEVRELGQDGVSRPVRQGKRHAQVVKMVHHNLL